MNDTKSDEVEALARELMEAHYAMDDPWETAFPKTKDRFREKARLLLLESDLPPREGQS